MKQLDLSGQKIGRLTVIKRVESKRRDAMWLCLCDCGRDKIVAASALKNKRTQSCGCIKIENMRRLGTAVKKHGETGSPEYRSWRAMLTRCSNPNATGYHNYGGRGIKVCDRWLNSFENFLADMGKRPSLKHSLDRHPNNNGDYELSNCRWATKEQQNRGVRTNLWLEHNGLKMVVEDWRIRWNLCKNIIQGHLNRGKTFAEVFDIFEASRRYGPFDPLPKGPRKKQKA